MSGGVKESKLAAREARTRSVTLLRMTTALPKKEVFVGRSKARATSSRLNSASFARTGVTARGA